RPRRDLFLRRRRVDRVVQPAMPGGRHDRSFGGAVVDHPAPLVTERWIDLAAPGAVIAIAELVLAHELAIERGPHQRAEAPPDPAGKEGQKNLLQRRVPQDRDRRPVHAPPPARSPPGGSVDDASRQSLARCARRAELRRLRAPAYAGPLLGPLPRAG